MTVPADGDGGADIVGLYADLAVDLGSLHLRALLTVAAGDTVAVLGPNGAGKTTVLRTLAGLHRVDRGCIRLAGVVLDGGGDGAWVPPERRPVGLVSQDDLLFPHLSAVDNVAFGLRAGGRRRRAARAEAQECLARVGLADVAQLRPAELSGGQAQRVALARALVLQPGLLLLDESLSALDATSRAATRRELRRVLDDYDGSCVLVTHDAVDALALADRLLILEGGRVVQQGTPAEVVAKPRSTFAADLVGVNLFSGRASAGAMHVDDDLTLVTASPIEGEVLAKIHPRAVTLHLENPVGSSSRNVWHGIVRGVDLEDARARVRIELTAGWPAANLIAEVTPAAVRELTIEEGRIVWAAVKATEIEVYPR